MGVRAIVTASALAMGFGALWATPGLGGEPSTAATAETPPKAAPNDRSRRVCRNLVRSGSRLSTRYCHSRTEWEESAESARRLVQEGQTEGSSRDPPR